MDIVDGESAFELQGVEDFEAGWVSEGFAIIAGALGFDGVEVFFGEGHGDGF